MTIKAVVFDIGNVLIEWDPHRFYDAKLGSERRELLFAETGLEAMNLSVDAGAPFRRAVYDLADRYPEFRDEIRMWHDNWLDIASPAIDGSVRILRRLRQKGIPVFALTNFGAETFELARERYPFLNEFDRHYVSAHLGMVKPDPALYAHVEAECGLPPECLLFADDRPENVAAAVQRGWNAHLFKDPGGWARVLREYGLLMANDCDDLGLDAAKAIDR